jgi:hypothetical protein
MDSSLEVTALLRELAAGKPDAGPKLIPLVYSTELTT